MILDNYTSAVITMIGMTFDSVGGLYLAYDLLGGEDGPLSKLTRIVNYSLMFFLIGLLAFNFKFALIAGIGFGIATATHLHRISRDQNETKRFLLGVALIRGITIGWGACYVLSHVAACVAGVGVFLTSFLLPAYFNVSPRIWFKAEARPTINRKKLFFSSVIGLIMGAMVMLGELIGGDPNAIYTAARGAIVVTLGVSAVSIFGPTIEWYADRVPDKRMGYIGVIMFLIGFALQSIPSLITVLN